MGFYLIFSSQRLQVREGERSKNGLGQGRNQKQRQSTLGILSSVRSKGAESGGKGRQIRHPFHLDVQILRIVRFIHLMGVHLRRVPHKHASHERVSHKHAPHEHSSDRRDCAETGYLSNLDSRAVGHSDRFNINTTKCRVMG
jgi:hypothetical protein